MAGARCTGASGGARASSVPRDAPLSAPCPPQVSVATHSVLNIARRVVMIAVTAAAFGTHISPLNWCGVGVTAVGFAAFAHSKRRGPPPRRRRTDAGLSPV